VANSLQGQVAVVTGSGRGFGRAIAQTLAAEGASVVITARSANEIDETVELITKAGGQAVATTADVTKRADIENLRTVAEKEFGTVTLAIHNAGVPWPFGPTWYVDPDRWWEAQTVHARAAMYMIHTFVPPMIDGDGGRFIVVSSAGGVNVGQNISGYGVAKSTQIRIAQFLGGEGADKGVFAFAIHPGDVLTGISDLTMNDPDAQKYNAAFVERLTSREETEEDRRAGFQACADLCANLGSGKYDGLSGRYLRPDDDLDALLAAGGQVPGWSLGVVPGQPGL
jgi:NAD(P)-dependent dehydrogenase (short-subunit alcohol dehydrogenase family)